MSVFLLPENMKGMIFMEQRNELKDLLYEKMSKEQDNFIEKLKSFIAGGNYFEGIRKDYAR